MRRAIFPGTFDPFTIGHSSVVSRALTFIDEIVIGIGINENKNKLVKYEILCFLLIANPFGYTCINSFWMQNEYRKMFMILVPAVIVAAFVVELTSGYQHIWAKALCLTGCAGFVILSMYFLFTQPKIQVIENQYKVPDKVVELDSLLREENHDIKNMIAPREVCSWIREINESVQLLYGEDLINHMIQDLSLIHI